MEKTNNKINPNKTISNKTNKRVRMPTNKSLKIKTRTKKDKTINKILRNIRTNKNN